MIFLFSGHFYLVSHRQSNSNKFKDFKTFEYYGIPVETFELITVVYRGIKKLTPKPKFELHDKKYVQGTQKFVRFR